MLYLLLMQGLIMKRASAQEVGEAIRDFCKKDGFEDEYAEHIKNDCRYGQPDGYDDFINECECGIENTERETEIHQLLDHADMLKKISRGE